VSLLKNLLALLVGLGLGGLTVSAVGSTALAPIHLQPGQQITVYADSAPPLASLSPSPSYPVAACSIAADPSGRFYIVSASGVLPTARYAIWWSVAATDGGQPFYFASGNAATSGGDGTVQFVMGAGRSGYWEVYVFPAGAQPYDEAVSVAECELWAP